MKRGRFLYATAAVAAWASLRARAARARPSLRVLLGMGDVEPLASGGFEFAGRQYRGSFSHAPDGSIVNVVALEDYLYSVVPREMSSSWPTVALQMQAICARTFVVRHSDPQRPYDVVPSQLNQVYQGIETESKAGRAAVDATAGTVLFYDSECADMAYSSCCGGHTESAADAWGGSPDPYLGGVVCPYCTQAPDFRWTSEIPLADVEQAMRADLRGGRLRDVRLGSTDRSGRVREFAMLTDRATVIVRGSDLRIDIGPRLMRSLLIRKLELRATGAGPVFHLEGDGNGHGVGLCQWGARGMALAESSVAGIASFYFPGTSLRSI
ncbi:MAG TPA: SpoIID/LytB domain-containing protein [Candidatus Tyrphobacter sp.]